MRSTCWSGEACQDAKRVRFAVIEWLLDLDVVVQIWTGSVVFVCIYRVRYVKEQTAKKKVKCYLGLADYFFSFKSFFGWLDLTGVSCLES